MPRVLIVEDNQLIREAVAGYFKMDDYEVVDFPGVQGVMESLDFSAPDLIILDILLEDGNGITLAKKIRARGIETPILFLSARDDESHRIMGFEAGGDDYVIKPFSPKELLLRAKALLKRSGAGIPEAETMQRCWTNGDQTLLIDSAAHRVLLNGEEIKLTGAEWKILTFLADKEDIVVSREQILGECLNYYFEGSDKTVNTHMANLRSKLGSGEWVETVRGFGYRFTGKKQ